VVAHLTAAGLRTIVPYLRGFGPTRFLDPSTHRSGQLAALGQDAIELAQILGFEHYAVVGHDWGARAAYIASTEDARHVSHAVAISVGYGTNDPHQIISLQQARNYWYHWYFCLPRGLEIVRQSRRDLCQFLWDTWSPTWKREAEEFDITAASFDNVDWPDITVHSYRHRWGRADGDPHYEELERRLATVPHCTVPTLVLHGGSDACNDPATSANRESHFSGGYRRTVLPGLGHFPQREDPGAVAAEIIAWLRPNQANSTS